MNDQLDMIFGCPGHGLYLVIYPKVAIFIGTLMVDQRILEGTLPSTRVQKETQQKTS